MKKIKICVLVLITTVSLLLIGTSVAQMNVKNNYVPENGYVPDQETAIKIAVAVWYPIYGKEEIDTRKPFVAKLHGNVWHVYGSLPKNWKGGVPEAEISKKTGEILRIAHGK